MPPLGSGKYIAPAPPSPGSARAAGAAIASAASAAPSNAAVLLPVRRGLKTQMIRLLLEPGGGNPQTRPLHDRHEGGPTVGRGLGARLESARPGGRAVSNKPAIKGDGSRQAVARRRACFVTPLPRTC